MTRHTLLTNARATRATRTRLNAANRHLRRNVAIIDSPSAGAWVHAKFTARGRVSKNALTVTASVSSIPGKMAWKPGATRWQCTFVKLPSPLRNAMLQVCATFPGPNDRPVTVWTQETFNIK
jgi:hypothetical protein